MNTSKYITVVIGSDKISIAEPITRVDYGLKLRIKGVALPAAYEVDFSLSEKGGESVTVIGDAQGAEIPVDHIKTGKNIFAYLYWTGEDYGRRVKKIMIPNDAGPERTDIVPEPAEQSVIDQTITKLNEAVGHAPKIGEDGYWYVWNPEQGDYVSTEVAAEGQDYTLTDDDKTEIAGRVELTPDIKLSSAMAVIQTDADRTLQEDVNIKIQVIAYQGLNAVKPSRISATDITVRKLNEATGYYNMRMIPAYVSIEPTVGINENNFIRYTLPAGWEMMADSGKVTITTTVKGKSYAEEYPWILEKDTAAGLVVADEMLCAVYEEEAD